MNKLTTQTLIEFLDQIDTPTLIISSHRWPQDIDWSCGGKASLLTVFDLNLEAAGLFTLHQIAAAIELFGCREMVLMGHFPGKLLEDCLLNKVWEDNTFDALAGMSRATPGDGFSIRSEKLVQAAIYLQVQFLYLKYFLDHNKWKYRGQEPSLQTMLLGEDRVVCPLEKFEKQQTEMPINYVLN